MMSEHIHNSLINGIATGYLDINDRATQYGDGLFETILCQDAKLLYWQQHYQRLQTSADRLKIACPSPQCLLDDIAKLMADRYGSAQMDHAIKIMLTRGIGNRGYSIEKNMKANRIVTISAVTHDYSSILSGSLLSGDLYLCQQQISINESLAGIKHLNRLENVLARNEWIGQRYIDGLMADADGNIIEGTMSNLFAVKAERLFTPSLERSGVNGIMRDAVIRAAENLDIDVEVCNMNIDDLRRMDALFISNSLIGMKAINEFETVKFTESTITGNIFNILSATIKDHAQDI